jgi:hypothetical protein
VSAVQHLGLQDRFKQVPLGVCTEEGSGTVFPQGLLIRLAFLLWLVEQLTDDPFEQLVLEVSYILGTLSFHR